MHVELEPITRERLEALPAFGAVLTAAERSSARSGPRVYLVGGAVRDLLLGRTPLDLDVVVEGDPDAFITELVLCGGAVAERHPQFGTASLVIDGQAVDVARSRRERYPHPGSLPVVDAAPLSEDLLRRDFTINSLAVSPSEPRAPLAPSGALDDLRAMRLRVLHERSFIDDPTRLWRLVRYAARGGFEIEELTSLAARAAVAGGALWTVGGHRIGAELLLALDRATGIGALRLAEEIELDEAVAVGFGLGGDAGRAQAERALALLPEDGSARALLLACATLELGDGGEAPAGAARAGALLAELGMPSAVTGPCLRALDVAGELAGALPGAAALADSALARVARREPVEAIALAGALGGEAGAAAARRWLETLRLIALEIGGEDLLAAGVERGPRIGAGLEAALDAKLDGLVDGREAELAVALRGAG